MIPVMILAGAGWLGPSSCRPAVGADGAQVAPTLFLCEASIGRGAEVLMLAWSSHAVLSSLVLIGTSELSF
jgi:hypothetical protein